MKGNIDFSKIDYVGSKDKIETPPFSKEMLEDLIQWIRDGVPIETQVSVSKMMMMISKRMNLNTMEKIDETDAVEE